MKKSLILCFYTIFTYSSFAQIGITSGVQFFQATEWESHLQTSYDDASISLFNPVLYAGIDYWFRLKNKRVEFTPELAFANYQTEIITNRVPNIEGLDTYKTNYYSLYLNTNFYILDFGGDCNCPTFNKDGDIIKKGFFIRLSPAIHYNTKFSSLVSTAGSVVNEDNKDAEVNFGLRAGAGIDIGISPFITLTPLVMGIYNLPSEWNHFGGLEPETNILVEDKVINLFAGLRLGFRFDELNKYGYR